jgi:hypothetical protein
MDKHVKQGRPAHPDVGVFWELEGQLNRYASDLTWGEPAPARPRGVARCAGSSRAGRRRQSRRRARAATGSRPSRERAVRCGPWRADSEPHRSRTGPRDLPRPRRAHLSALWNVCDRVPPSHARRRRAQAERHPRAAVLQPAPQRLLGGRGDRFRVASGAGRCACGAVGVARRRRPRRERRRRQQHGDAGGHRDATARARGHLVCT